MGRCHPLTVLGDHSRYAVGLVACADETGDTVRHALSGLFRVHGLPARMLMDNGAPWGDAAGQPYTRLTVWLLRPGVRASHGRPYHPPTQGTDERVHRTPTAELLSRHTRTDLGECGRRFDPRRRMSDRERPREAPGLAVPADRYRVRPRPLPMSIRAGRPCVRNRPVRACRTVSPVASAHATSPTAYREWSPRTVSG